MVQLEPHLTLTLKYLASCGAVITTEQQAALEYSLPIKRIEAGLRTLVLWGKILCLNGKDYLIAEGYNQAEIKDSYVSTETKYYYSQDGVRWSDLQSIDGDTSTRSAKIRGQLSGDPSKNYELEERDPNAPEKADGTEEEPKNIVFQIPELSVLRFRVDSINNSTGVIPANSMVINASNQVVSNHLFAGCAFPGKLESYQHRFIPPGGPSLAEDLRGSWSIHYDPFRAIAQCRSLLWPGYFFYYSNNDLSWGSLYVGNGLRNNDLIFML
uniref:Radial spoke head protein 9 homolog n=1 Tax=Polytomella parva TaxID=51329 RepID=A0A7S0V3D7_9CHLO|mmetsp:Transcript_29409/g.53964  ORF Transcript_29409/g.53964 Transcript_29409/m.53964 type:complete len:269 (+) Transcript_29409:45-851(+)